MLQIQVGEFLVGDRIFQNGGNASGEIAKVVRNDQNVITRLYLRQLSGSFASSDVISGKLGASFTAGTVYSFPNGIFYIDFGKFAVSLEILRLVNIILHQKI